MVGLTITTRRQGGQRGVLQTLGDVDNLYFICSFGMGQDKVTLLGLVLHDQSSEI